MSNDPRINSALFNFCIAADDGPRTTNPDGTSSHYDFSERASENDLQWLRQAMQQVEAPDRAVKRCVTTIMDWILPIRDVVLANAIIVESSHQQSNTKDNNNQDQKAPLLLLPPPRTTTTTTTTTTVTADSNSNDKNKEHHSISATVVEAPSANTSKNNHKKLLTISELPKINDDVLASIDELIELCEDLNYAKEFLLMKGIPLFIGILRLTANAAVNPKNDKTSLSPEDLEMKQKQWSELRASLARCLAGSAANFDEFQAQMTKFHFSSAFLPLLSNKQHFCSKFPAELSAILLCLTNVIRQYDPALQQFLLEDGMFHLANCVEFLMEHTKNEKNNNINQQQQHFIVALRRAFSFARYLVEESGVTSPRIVKAAADLIVSQSSILLETKKNSSSKSGGNNNEDDDANSKKNAEAGGDEIETRNVENTNVAATFACKVIVSALNRTIAMLKNQKPNQQKTMESMMPQWGNYLVRRFSTSPSSSSASSGSRNFVLGEDVAAGKKEEGNAKNNNNSTWWNLFSPIVATSVSTAASDVSSLFVPHHDLHDGISELVETIAAVSKETAQSDKDVSLAFKKFEL